MGSQGHGTQRPRVTGTQGHRIMESHGCGDTQNQGTQRHNRVTKTESRGHRDTQQHQAELQAGPSYRGENQAQQSQLRGARVSVCTPRPCTHVCTSHSPLHGRGQRYIAAFCSISRAFSC